MHLLKLLLATVFAASLKSTHGTKSHIICESNSATIKCKEGTKLLITEAIYGRSDKTTCPHQQISDLNCRSSTAFDIISRRCNNKGECYIESNNSLYGDPCVGTYKYLKLNYECVEDTPTENKSHVFCEHDSGSIKCKEGTKLLITEAIYGRTDKTTCPHQLINDLNCRSSTAFDIISRRCNYKSECYIESNNNVYGDPCAGTYKYVKLNYECIKDPSTEQKSYVICEKDTATIKCMEGTKLYITGAIYGRTDSGICPSEQIKDLNCRSPTAFDVISQRCNNKNECFIESSNNWFGEPCAGTLKYLKLDYKCINETSIENVICESNSATIKCKEGSNLLIIDANYGRTDETTCPHQQIKDLNCKTSKAFDIISRRCNKKSECYLEASNNWFGDPCVNTYKYLKFAYKCIDSSKEILN